MALPDRWDMNPFQVVNDFEQALADYAGSPYCVTVESCSAALFLCCVYRKVREMPEVEIPKITYPSVPAAVIHAGGRVRFIELEWQEKGYYYLGNTNIIDSAKRLTRGSYIGDSLTCLSFHYDKTISIGRGGAILTDSEEAMTWLRCARFDGRHERPLHEDDLAFVGWNMYMTPEQASRGLMFMHWIKDDNIGPNEPYQDLSKYQFYTDANR